MSAWRWLVGGVVLAMGWYACETFASGLPKPALDVINGECRGDVLTYCGERSDPRDVISCLIARWGDLSRKCKVALVEGK